MDKRRVTSDDIIVIIIIIIIITIIISIIRYPKKYIICIYVYITTTQLREVYISICQKYITRTKDTKLSKIGR